MTSQQLASEALFIFQANKSDRVICEALLDEFFVGPEYTATLDAVRDAMSEPGVTALCVNTNSITGYRWQSCFSEAF